METKINVFPTPAEACKHIAQMLTQYVKKGANIALSGGSTPKLLFEIIAKDYTDVDWSNVKLFWGDERMVPEEDLESNFGEFARILINAGIIKREQCFQMEYSGNEQHDLRLAEEKVRTNVPFCGDFPRFDLIILGLGNDGHTASIFPGNLWQFKSEKIVDMVSHPQSGQRRITLTGSAINNASEIAFLCTGASKANVLKEIIVDKNELLPAAHVSPRCRLQWFLDAAAASKIKYK